MGDLAWQKVEVVKFGKDPGHILDTEKCQIPKIPPGGGFALYECFLFFI